METHQLLTSPLFAIACLVKFQYVFRQNIFGRVNVTCVSLSEIWTQILSPLCNKTQVADVLLLLATFVSSFVSLLSMADTLFSDLGVHLEPIPAVIG